MAVGKSFSFLKAKTETFLTQLLTMQNNFESIEEAIAVATGDTFQSIGESSLSGGCINQASKISGKDGRDFFVKRNSLDFLPFFEAEGRALREIASTRTIKVPETITLGKTSNHSFIVLNFIQEGVSSSKAQEDMGRQLADLHRIQQNHFGWSMDNCIGATPQPNPPTNRWIDFYRQYRLEHQFQLANSKGATFSGSHELLDKLEVFFADYEPFPSLLHGDLWGGNASYDQDGKPFIFDPASYYGDRETDLAFTYMFGGFSNAFYQAYDESFPLHSGFEDRKTLYNLYHELNHFNLFGGGYGNSAQSSIHRLLSKI